jgi:hypothetical protein
MVTLITKSEVAVLIAFCHYCVDWSNPDTATWVAGFNEECNLSLGEFNSVIESLAKKGLIVTNGKSFWLTDFSRDWLTGNKNILDI